MKKPKHEQAMEKEERAEAQMDQVLLDDLNPQEVEDNRVGWIDEPDTTEELTDAHFTTFSEDLPRGNDWDE